MSSGQMPILPIWLVAPAAAALLLAIGGHMLITRRSSMPASRRRIRVANAWLMLVTIPLAAYAFGVVGPEDPRRFVLVWTAVAGLVFLVILLAILDMLNTIRLAAAARQRLRVQIKVLHATLNKPQPSR